MAFLPAPGEIPLHTVVNVASVPQRSPFRYPGGKTWLIPYVRLWLGSLQRAPEILVEPFGGGGIVALTAAAEGLAHKVIIAEIDEDVASVWQTMLGKDADWLMGEIIDLELSDKTVEAIFDQRTKSTRARALAAIVTNRINRGGIMAPGAGRVKNGENGKGLTSRWYPETLCRRIRDIAAMNERIEFVAGDGLHVLERTAHHSDAAFFVDPPYTVAGRRLYRHNEIDHVRLFDLAAALEGNLLMTYDDSKQIVHLAMERDLAVHWIPMKTTHHCQKMELLIGRDLTWLNQSAPAAEHVPECAARMSAG
ncbi:MAG: DNA adenine methylase [Armatimonadia bacterium]